MENWVLAFSETRSEFAHLSEAEVWAAINENGESPISCEVTRLVCCFWKRFQDCARKHHNVPPHIMHVAVRYPIERVAVIMMIGFIESETGISPQITWH
jgi:hypothetical protein